MAIKEFFKNVGNGVKNATNKAAKKIDDTVDLQKLKYRITKKEDEIKAVYQSLGETIVNAVQAEEEFDDKIVEAVTKIESLREEIAQMNEERLVKEKKTVCPECKTEVSLSVVFCPKCGLRLREDDPEESTASAEEIPTEGTGEAPTESIA